MEIFGASAFHAIKSKHTRLVKLAVAIALAAMTFSTALANSIDSRFKVIRHTKSHKTYLIEAPGRTVVRLNQVWVFQREDKKPWIMGKVIKIYPKQNRFALQIVSNLSKQLPKSGAWLVAAPRIDRTRVTRAAPELTPEPVPLGDSPPNDLNSTAEPDPVPLPMAEPSMDSASPPPVESAGLDVDKAFDDAAHGESPKGNRPMTLEEAEDEDSDDEVSKITVEDVQPIDPYGQWLSFELGLLKNTNSSGVTAYYTGAGGRYGITLFRSIFISRRAVQDSIVLEGGAFLYKIAGFASDGDAFTVSNLIGGLRYNIYMADSFALYFYGGYSKNLVLASSNGLTSDEALALAAGTPAGGGGFIFHLGPQWDLRFGLGIDMIGGGLMLRF